VGASESLNTETEVEGPLTLCVAACELGALLTCADALDSAASVDTTFVSWGAEVAFTLVNVVPAPSGWPTVLSSGRPVTCWARIAGATRRRRPRRLVERRILKNTV
jgi:hypothetical protein